MAGQDPKDPDDTLIGRISQGLNELSQEFSGVADEMRQQIRLPDATAFRFFNAAKRNHPDVLDQLIAEGVSPNSVNKDGETALHVAAASGAVDAMKKLIDKGAKLSALTTKPPQRSVMEVAIDNNQPDVIAFLMSLGIDKGRDMPLLHRACKGGKRDAAIALLEGGLDMNERNASGATPLMMAICNGHTEMVKDLLEEVEIADGINTLHATSDPRRRTAFQLAVEQGDREMIRAMIEKGGDVNKPDATGRTPLFAAIEVGDIAIIRMLVKAGADLNRPCGPEGTPLTHACRLLERNEETLLIAMIHALIELGANPNIAATDGNQPLHDLVTTKRSLSVITALLEHPVEKDTPGKDGMTALIIAAGLEKPDHLQLLLGRGANPNARHGEDARTALIEAVQKFRPDNVAALLKAGASPKLFDAHGKPALSYARLQNTHKIRQMLEQALIEQSFTNQNKKPGPG